MPIIPLHSVERISQEDFRELSFAVMAQVFAIHNDFGRFFNESIYKRELVRRFPGVELEFPIKVTHDSFSRTYHLDALIANAAEFEFKAVDVLTSRHRGQLYNYLLLLDLSHGKLINVRPESVEHEFVNASLPREDRFAFGITTTRWNTSLNQARFVLDSVVSFVRDWGTGLEIGMYEAALTHFLGGEATVVRDIVVHSDNGVLGYQRMNLAGDDTAFRITAFERANERFEGHLRRFVQHVELSALFWINIAVSEVTFTSIERVPGSR